MASHTADCRGKCSLNLNETATSHVKPDNMQRPPICKSDSAKPLPRLAGAMEPADSSGRSNAASDATPLPVRPAAPCREASQLAQTRGGFHEAAHRLKDATMEQAVREDRQGWAHDLTSLDESPMPAATSRATPLFRYTVQGATTKSLSSLASPSTMASSRDQHDSALHSLRIPTGRSKLYHRRSSFKRARSAIDRTPQMVASGSQSAKSETEVPTDVSEAATSDIVVNWESKQTLVERVGKVSTPVRILCVLVILTTILSIGIGIFANELISGRCWTTFDTTTEPRHTPTFFTGSLSSLHFPGLDLPSFNPTRSSSPSIVCYHLSRVRFIPPLIRSWLNVAVLNKVDAPVGDFYRSRPAPFLNSIKSSIAGARRWAFNVFIGLQLRIANGLMAAAQFVTPNNMEAPAAQARSAIDRKAKISLASVNSRITMMENSNTIQDALQHSKESLALRHHNEQFTQRIELISDNMYVAIGYGLANVVLIDTEDGLILFDCLESPSTMRHLMEDWVEFRNHSGRSYDERYVWGQKVIALIYSHFHADHVFGAVAVFQPGITQIWAHETTNAEINKVFVMTAGTTYTRSMRQFGTILTEKDGYINAGLGPCLHYGGVENSGETTGVLNPTHVWSGQRKTVEIGHELLEFIFAAGESRDQTIVWFPKRKILFGADNIYKSFPNIYAIRGTESRDAMIWVRSLDLMRSLQPEILVLGHTSPIRGAERISSTIQVYRDAIQFVHDQTVRYMNKGHPVDEVVSLVQLPSQLAQHPYLQQFYGTVPWAVRAVFHHYVGWFSGRAEELHRLSTQERALRLVQLVGGWRELLTHALDALARGDLQWALELATAAQYSPPAAESARRVRILALRALAATQTSAPGRNWYLTAAKEDEERTESAGNEHLTSLLTISKEQRAQCLRSLKSPLEVFDFVPMRLRAERAPAIDLAINFTFTDTAETICAYFRNGIQQSTPSCERQSDLDVITTDSAWRRLLMDELNPFMAVATGQLRLKTPSARDYLRLKGVMGLFEKDI